MSAGDYETSLSLDARVTDYEKEQKENYKSQVERIYKEQNNFFNNFREIGPYHISKTCLHLSPLLYNVYLTKDKTICRILSAPVIKQMLKVHGINDPEFEKYEEPSTPYDNSWETPESVYYQFATTSTSRSIPYNNFQKKSEPIYNQSIFIK